MSSLESLLSQLDEAVKTKQTGNGSQPADSAPSQAAAGPDAKELSAALQGFLGSQTVSMPAAAANVESADTSGVRVALEQFIGSSIEPPRVQPAPGAQTPAAQTTVAEPPKTAPRPEPPSSPIVGATETCAYCGRDPIGTEKTTTEAQEPTPAPELPIKKVPAPHFTWKQHLSAAESAFSRGDIEKSEAILILLNDVSKVVILEIPVHMRLVTQLANLHILKGNPAEACQLLTDMLELVENTEFKKDIATAFCIDLQGQCFEMQSQFADAERCFKSAKDLAKEVLGSEHSGTDYFRNRLAKFAEKHNWSNLTTDGTVPVPTVLAAAAAEPEVIAMPAPAAVPETPIELAPPAVPEKPIELAPAPAAVEPIAAPEPQEKQKKVAAEDRTLLDDLREQPCNPDDPAPQLVSDPVAEVMFAKFLTNAKNCLAKGNYEEADLYLRSAMQKAVGIADNDARKCEGLLLLAAVMEKQDRLEKAQRLLETCLSNAFRYRAPDDIHVAYSLKSLAQLQRKLLNMSLAERYYKQSLDIHITALGEDHPTTTQTRTEYQQFLEYLEEERKWQGLTN